MSMQHDMPQTSTASVTSLRSHVLLCREGIPEALEDLYRAAEVGTIHEASWIVIHFLMLETGYMCASEVLYNKLLLYDSRYGEGKIIIPRLNHCSTSQRRRRKILV